MPKKPIMVRNIDEDLWNRFKGACHSQGRSVQDVLVELISDYIKKGDKNGGRKNEGR